MSERKMAAIRNEAVQVPAFVQEERVVQRLAAYCRVSTLLEEQEDSYETQCAYYTRLADADPKLELVDVYGDHGVSGLSVEARPAFQRMMRDCMDGKVDLIMTKSVSRFARNLVDCVNCVRHLREKGIPVIFEREGLNSMEPGCDMTLSLLATLAQEEVNNLSRHVRWALESRCASGDPACAARYGYRKADNDGGKREWTVYEPEAIRVRKAFRLATQGYTYRDIITVLDRFEIAEGTATRWSRNRLRSLLRSEIYVGDLLTNKTYRPDYLSKRAMKNDGQRPQYYIEGHHAPIVDRETFACVAEKLEAGKLHSKKQKKRRRY